MPTPILLILIAIALLGLSVLALAVSMLIRKNGKFPETEVGKNRNMRKLGIRCTKQEEMMRRRKNSSTRKMQDSTCDGCCGEA